MWRGVGSSFPAMGRLVKSWPGNNGRLFVKQEAKSMCIVNDAGGHTRIFVDSGRQSSTTPRSKMSFSGSTTWLFLI